MSIFGPFTFSARMYVGLVLVVYLQQAIGQSSETYVEWVDIYPRLDFDQKSYECWDPELDCGILELYVELDTWLVCP
jgi:hypothetical protein